MTKSGKRLTLNDKDDGDQDIIVPLKMSKVLIIEYGNIKKDVYKESELTEVNNDYSNKISQLKKEGLYIYTDNDNNKYFYSFQKVSSDGNYFGLRCKDSNNCKGRAKYDIQTWGNKHYTKMYYYKILRSQLY